MAHKSYPFILFLLIIASFSVSSYKSFIPYSGIPSTEEIMNTSSDTSRNYQTPGVTENLPVFYKELADRLSYPLSWTSGEYDDFTEWKKEARAKVMESLIYSPPDVPFSPVVIDQEDRGSYTAQKVVLNISADSRILCYMLIPKGEGPFPAMVLFHDHGARFDIGKEKLIRPFNVSKEKQASSTEWVEQNYGGRYVGDELASKGYICFATDMLNWSDREGGGYEGQQAIALNLMFLGSSYAGTIAYEDMRSVEFLAGHPKVDTSRIGAMGHSVGSFRTWQVAALSDHVKAGVANCWMATVKGLLVPGNNVTRGNSGYTMLHPGLHRYLDIPDVASIACPKPMLFFNGSRDGLFPVPSVKAAYEKMHEIWHSQNADTELVTKLWDTKHIFNREMQEEAFEWLDEKLK